MCSIDWGLLAGVVTALGTVSLAIVGAFAARYAYKAAVSANETLRLEAEPIMMVGVNPSNDDDLPLQTARIEIHANGTMMLLPASAISKDPQCDFTIKNIGRAPAMNVTAYFAISDISSDRAASFGLFIESLSPQQTVIFRLRNAAPTVVNVTVTRVTRSSLLEIGKLEDAPFFLSSALPFPVG